MVRLRSAVFVALFALTASAQQRIFQPHPNAGNCKFEIPANDPAALRCDSELDRGVGSICTVKWINNGTDACTGHFAAYMGPVAQGTVDQGSTTSIATICRTVGLTPLPADLGGGVTSLETAQLCEGDGSIQPGAGMTMSARITPSPTFTGGRFSVGVTDTFAGIVNAVLGQFNLANCNLTIAAPSLVQSGLPYAVSWTAAAASTTYEVQEATKSDFSDAKTTVAGSVSQQFTHTATGAPATYYYRVRATACKGALGPYSTTATVIIAPSLDPTSKSFDLVVPQGSTTVIVQQVHLDNLPPNVSFSASSDRSFITVTPSTGTTSGGGTIDLTVRADPSSLGIGSNMGTVTVTTARTKSGRIVSLADNSKSVPVSVSVAAPVTQAPKTPPPATTWVIPAVAHRDGIGAQFLSDVRLGNATATATSSYQVTFTASNADGSKNARQTKIDLAPGQIAALNDVLRNLFGLGTTTADAIGVLEIRALGTNPAPGTLASSRAYSIATAGTFGQHVPAVPIDRVATADQRLILGHAGQTAAQRLNVGIAESLGFATSGHIRAFNTGGSQIADMPFTLQPFEQQQVNGFLARYGLNVAAARIDVIVDAPAPNTTGGGVTAYASMLDNSTHDASVVTGVKAASLTSKRLILPGVAEGTAIGQHSEVRVMNVGATSADATFTFFPRGASSIAKPVNIGPNEIRSFDNIVSSLFGQSSGDGSVVITTAADAQLLVTSRTFSAATGGGSFGLLQTAMTAADGISSSDAGLQVLQLEESDRFRSDLALVELTGAPVKVHVTLYGGDFKVAGSTDIDLGANEFRSDQNIATKLGATGTTYNGRIEVKVLSGSGRVGAYGALIDKASTDGTLLPASK